MTSPLADRVGYTAGSLAGLPHAQAQQEQYANQLAAARQQAENEIAQARQVYDQQLAQRQQELQGQLQQAQQQFEGWRAQQMDALAAEEQELTLAQQRFAHPNTTQAVPVTAGGGAAYSAAPNLATPYTPWLRSGTGWGLTPYRVGSLTSPPPAFADARLGAYAHGGQIPARAQGGTSMAQPIAQPYPGQRPPAPRPGDPGTHTYSDGIYIIVQHNVGGIPASTFYMPSGQLVGTTADHGGRPVYPPSYTPALGASPTSGLPRPQMAVEHPADAPAYPGLAASQIPPGAPPTGESPLTVGQPPPAPLQAGYDAVTAAQTQAGAQAEQARQAALAAERARNEEALAAQTRTRSYQNGDWNNYFAANPAAEAAMRGWGGAAPPPLPAGAGRLPAAAGGAAGTETDPITGQPKPKTPPGPTRGDSATTFARGGQVAGKGPARAGRRGPPPPPPGANAVVGEGMVKKGNPRQELLIAPQAVQQGLVKLAEGGRFVNAAPGTLVEPVHENPQLQALNRKAIPEQPGVPAKRQGKGFAPLPPPPPGRPHGQAQKKGGRR